MAGLPKYRDKEYASLKQAYGTEYGHKTYMEPKYKYAEVMDLLTSKYKWGKAMARQSEMKKGYMSDDYPSMEDEDDYTFDKRTYPEYRYRWGLPNFKFKWPKFPPHKFFPRSSWRNIKSPAKGSPKCKGLWEKLFPGWSGGARQLDVGQKGNYAYYARFCPTRFLPAICCPGLKIKGPAKVAVNSKTQFSCNYKPGCYYSWSAQRGRAIEGQYEAPDTPGFDVITVWEDFSKKICASKRVQVLGAGCFADDGVTPTTAGAASYNMLVGSSQTMSAVNANTFCVYTWGATSGTFAGAVYTAPLTINCSTPTNPVITLYCDGDACDTLIMGVYTAVQSGNLAWTQAYSFCQCGNPVVSPVTGSHAKAVGYSCYCLVENWHAHCDGTLGCDAPFPFSQSNTCSDAGNDGHGNGPCLPQGGAPDYVCANGGCACLTNWLCAGAYGTPGAWTDVRTDAQKIAGCCPQTPT